MSRCYALVYLRISSTDVDVLRRLSILGEMERVGTTTREMGRPLLRKDGVFPPLLEAGTWCKTAKPPWFTKSDTAGEVIFSGISRPTNRVYTRMPPLNCA